MCCQAEVPTSIARKQNLQEFPPSSGPSFRPHGIELPESQRSHPVLQSCLDQIEPVQVFVQERAELLGFGGVPTCPAERGRKALSCSPSLRSPWQAKHVPCVRRGNFTPKKHRLAAVLLRELDNVVQSVFPAGKAIGELSASRSPRTRSEVRPSGSSPA